MSNICHLSSQTIPKIERVLLSENRQVVCYLRVLIGNLQQQCKVCVVKRVVQSQQSAVHAALPEVVGVLLQPDALHPAHHTLIGPDHHICEEEEAVKKGRKKASVCF